ncbi:hypothetical protein PR048_018317 [Dryococelus australis]|uniref:HAT C-terminal dimerisation domain-containing protein n=1 Tax=Dryococelus australis TaxID=614101 RepID=A0ABQ9HC23_9NEOP|nr:hypothetical protein PR048_018317 [Dryococelus australis]
MTKRLEKPTPSTGINLANWRDRTNSGWPNPFWLHFSQGTRHLLLRVVDLSTFHADSTIQRCNEPQHRENLNSLTLAHKATTLHLREIALVSRPCSDHVQNHEREYQCTPPANTSCDIPTDEEHDSKRLKGILSIYSNIINKTSIPPAYKCPEAEVEMYLAEPPIPTNSIPLQYWKTSAYTRLHKAAQKYLSSPAGSVASERLSSSAGLIFSKIRSSLNPEKLRQLATRTPEFSNKLHWRTYVSDLHCLWCKTPFWLKTGTPFCKRSETLPQQLQSPALQINLQPAHSRSPIANRNKKNPITVPNSSTRHH